jgi:hypothetical protein
MTLSELIRKLRALEDMIDGPIDVVITGPLPDDDVAEVVLVMPPSDDIRAGIMPCVKIMPSPIEVKGEKSPADPRPPWKWVAFHDDPPCHARLTDSGCPKCKFHPDSQSIVFEACCPNCNALLSGPQVLGTLTCAKCCGTYSRPEL